MDGFFAQRKVRLFNREALENAGLRLSQADFFVLVLAGAFVGAVAGLRRGRPAAGDSASSSWPRSWGTSCSVSWPASAATKFDQQLGDTLQLLSGGLRAGHSILRAIDAAATESQSPDVGRDAPGRHGNQPGP